MARREAGESIPLSRFGVLVAQLESIVTSASQKPPDQLLCFDLLSVLVAAIEEEPKDSIQLWQRKCEDALYSLLIIGARHPVRRLASLAMVRVIAKGDAISIYSRASSLQGWLADGKKNEPLSCSGVARCLGELYQSFGRKITSGLTETTTIAAKLMKFKEVYVRKDALKMLENALEGCAGSGPSAAYTDAFRIIMRGVNDKSFIVKVSAARCLKTFARIGGPGLGMTDLENSISYCVKALDDPVSSVRDAFAEALGGLLALAMNPEAQVKQRGSKHSVPQKKLEDGLQKHLILPFVKASGICAKDLRVGLALSWVFFLQVVRIKYCLPDSELQDFALLCIDMLRGNASQDAHALACVLYILRVGIADQMSEPTQRSFLVFLGRKLEAVDYSPSMRVATLRILSYLLTTLGEVPVEFKDVLDDTVVSALSQSSLHVRIEAALTLRALAEVDPTCVGGLISYAVTTLHALRESVSLKKGTELSLQLDSLHGQATLIAALVSVSPKLLLGYPAMLPRSVFDVSKKMLTEFSRNPSASAVEKESGWLLLASLISSMPKEELEDQVFDILLLWAGFFVGNITRIQDLTSELRVLSSAVEALAAFIRSFLSPAVLSNGSTLLQPVLAYLSVALSYISSLFTKLLSNKNHALALFTIRTLMAYESIPDPMAFKSEHAKIIDICTTIFSDPSGWEESPSLRVLLNKKDASLGPWIPGRDWFEDDLRAFDGGKDGIMPCVWQDENYFFPQSESISKRLVNQMLLCFGTMFSTQDDGGKLLLLRKIDQCLKNSKKQPWHLASVTNSCVGLLAGLKAVLALRPQKLTTEVLNMIQSVFQAILADNENLPAQRRASSEGLGLLARLGSDVFTARMTRSLLGELVAATDPNYLSSIALSLGCIYRSAGGMALSTLVTSAVSAICSLAKSSNSSLQLWSLHSLLLTIEAAGLSYVPQVQATLILAMEIILSDENGLHDLRQEIGRLINAIVAVLGPELAPGSIFFYRCKSVITEISSSQETSTLLESVRFTQQLVLFAPRAASVHSHVQVLLPTLSSKQPSLRHLAVSTLHHLIEKDPVAMIEVNIEEYLFSMLDEETDPEIVRLLRSTITQWLYKSCPSCPSRWLSVFHSMVLSTSTRNPIENISSLGDNNLTASTEGDATLYYVEDDEDMISSSKAEPIQDSLSAYGANSRREKHLRYRTRLFAAECLSNLPAAVGSNTTHFDIFEARSMVSGGLNSSSDWLVLHLQELVSISYQISTGQFEGMQPIGVRLLSIIIEKFGSTSDPDLPGHLLLEQYQAQLVSAVRSAISSSSGPLLLEAGLELARKILTRRIISGDHLALNRIYSLISRPLIEIKDIFYPSFAEWVACKIKIRLLAAHASIKCYVYQFLREQTRLPDEYVQLIPLLSSSSTTLSKFWISILRDYLYICFGLQSKVHYKPFLEGIQSLVVSFKVRECLDEAWPLVLQAIALDAVPAKLETDNASKLDPDKSSSTLLLSGHMMARLEENEFHLLCGISLLIMFQSEQHASNKEVKMLLSLYEKRKVQDQLFHEAPDMMASKKTALLVLESLSNEAFFRYEFFSVDMCTEVLQVLLYACPADSLIMHAASILSQIVQFCPDAFFESENFTTAAIELCLKYLTGTFVSDSLLVQNKSGSQDLLAMLANSAKTMACRMNRINQLKMILALISLSSECFTKATTDLSLSRIAYFFQSISSLAREYFQGEADHDNNISQVRVLVAWATMLTTFSKTCMKRIANIVNKVDDTGKNKMKILALCLEEAVALAELVYETLHFAQENTSGRALLLSILKSCVECVRDTLTDANRQVQALGVYVIKSIVQRQLTDGSQAKRKLFILIFAGEVLGDILVLIQQAVKGQTSSLTIVGECLRLLFLVNTLAQATECQQLLMMLLLDALLLVFSVSRHHDFQEFAEINMIARKMVANLVQIPSVASQIKDVMLSIPVIERQQIQDMIRASVTQGPIGLQVKLSVQSDPSYKEIHQIQSSDLTKTRIDETKKESIDRAKEDIDDDDDNWDSFQSLPAYTASTSKADAHAKINGSGLVSLVDSSPVAVQLDKKHVDYHDLSLNVVSEEINDGKISPSSHLDEASLHGDGISDNDALIHHSDNGVIESDSDRNIQDCSQVSTEFNRERIEGNDTEDLTDSSNEQMEDNKKLIQDCNLEAAASGEGREDSSDKQVGYMNTNISDNESKVNYQHMPHDDLDESVNSNMDGKPQQDALGSLSSSKECNQDNEDSCLQLQDGAEVTSRDSQEACKHDNDALVAESGIEILDYGSHLDHSDSVEMDRDYKHDGLKEGLKEVSGPLENSDSVIDSGGLHLENTDDHESEDT